MMSRDRIVGITTKGHAMTTNRSTTPLDLDRLAVDLDRHDHAVAARYTDAVADLAREQGLATPSLQVLTDPTTSTVARERALAVVAARLRQVGTTRHDVLAAAA